MIDHTNTAWHGAQAPLRDVPSLPRHVPKAYAPLSMTPLRTVFLGSDAISLPLLNWLVGPEGSRHATLIAVYTQPDRPVGRGQKVQANAIKQWAEARGLPVRQPDKITPEVRAAYAAETPDLCLVMAYGHILRDDFIAIPPRGTINFHASLLPGLRGASPIQTAVATGAANAGVSLMRIVRALDAGPVADMEAVPVGPLDTALDVESRLAEACVSLLGRALPKLVRGELTFVEQDATKATFCRKLTKEDSGLDFSRAATELAARVNGLYPWPCAQVEWDGQALKIGLADALPGTGAPGQVLGSDTAGLLIGTGNGVLRARRLQRPGGRMLEATEFLRGASIAPGTCFPSRVMSPLVAAQPFPVLARR